MRTVRFLYKNLDHFKPLFWLSVMAAFFDGLVQFLLPILLAEFTKTELSMASFNTLLPYIIGCFVFSLGFQWIIRRWGEALTDQFSDYLRLKYFKKLEYVPLRILHEYHSGYLHSLVNKIAQGGQLLAVQCMWLLAHGAAILSLFLIYTAMSSVAIAILNIVMLVLFLYVSLLLSKKMVPLAERLNIAHARLIGKFVDLLSNIQTVQRLGIFKFAEQHLSAEVAVNAECIQDLQNFHANRWFLLHSIFGFCFLSTIAFLLYLIAQGQVAASILILFIWAFGVLRSQIERLSELVKSLLEIDAYVQSLEQVLAQVGEGDSGSIDLDSFKEINLMNVELLHEGANQVIAMPSFHIQKGEKILVSGESGQGKSTLLDVISGLLKPQSGSVKVDGRELHEYGMSSLRSAIAVVSQEVELFDMSIRDNLCLGTTHSEDQLWLILNGLGLSPWLQNLPEGLETKVGEKGIKLSVGQKQRVNIARALLLDRPVILFDEPTSHLDEGTEDSVIKFLGEQLQTKTVVFVSHRPEISRLCSRHYEFKNHELREVS